jgi:hypothetical protein
MVMARTLKPITSFDRPYWVSYSAFHYSERQIRWLIENEGCFEEGFWPKEPAGEYVTEKCDRHERRWVEWIGCGSTIEVHPGKPPAMNEASFCKAKEIYGDVKDRIDNAGTPGKLLLAQLRAGYSCLDNDAENALRFVSGKKSKKTSYVKWLWQSRNRKSSAGN